MSIGLASHKVVVVEHDRKWPTLFKEEEARLLGITDGRIKNIEHVGSTAVAGLPAKPIIDMMAVVDDLASYREVAALLESAGYALLPERVNPGRISLPKGPPSNHTHHLTLVTNLSYTRWRVLIIRNFLRECEEARLAYGQPEASAGEAS